MVNHATNKKNALLLLRSQKGITLIEAIIALILAAIVFGILGPMIMQEIDAWVLSTSYTYHNDQHRSVLSTLAYDIENATEIVSIAPHDVRIRVGGVIFRYSLYSSADGTFYLYRERFDLPDWIGDAVIARKIAANGIEFRYLDQAFEETAVIEDIRAIMFTLTTVFEGTTITTGTTAVFNAPTDLVLSRH